MSRRSTDAFPLRHLVAAMLSATATWASAQVYKCDVNGTVTWQDAPCPEKPSVQSKPTAAGATRAEAIRRQADEQRAKNAAQRAEIEKGFRDPSADSHFGFQSKRLPGFPITQAQACRAVIAAVMGRDPRIVLPQAEQNGFTSLSYSRSSDQTTWHYRCRVMGNQAVWASSGGRWRDGPQDERIQLQWKDDHLVVIEQYRGGSKNLKQYQMAELE